MKIAEFEQRLRNELEALDHPEIVSVEGLIGARENTNHNLLTIKYASGGSSTVMVQSVRGPGISRSVGPYEVPKEAF